MAQIQLAISPSEFFRDKVNEAAHSLHIELEEHIEFYLVNLLSEFAIQPPANQPSDIGGIETPLVFMLERALEAPPERRLKIMKKMGDVSLYVSGYFQDYFNRKLFNVSYYMDMGRSAYQSVSHLMSDVHGDEHFASMYGELSTKFHQCVDIFATIADGTNSGKSQTGLLEIYARWNDTKSERLERQLSLRGIHPIAVSKKAQ
jgi:hypothetical protein